MALIKTTHQVTFGADSYNYSAINGDAGSIDTAETNIALVEGVLPLSRFTTGTPSYPVDAELNSTIKLLNLKFSENLITIGVPVGFGLFLKDGNSITVTVDGVDYVIDVMMAPTWSPVGLYFNQAIDATSFLANNAVGSTVEVTITWPDTDTISEYCKHFDSIVGDLISYSSKASGVLKSIYHSVVSPSNCLFQFDDTVYDVTKKYTLVYNNISLNMNEPAVGYQLGEMPLIQADANQDFLSNTFYNNQYDTALLSTSTYVIPFDIEVSENNWPVILEDGDVATVASLGLAYRFPTQYDSWGIEGVGTGGGSAFGPMELTDINNQYDSVRCAQGVLCRARDESGYVIPSSLLSVVNNGPGGWNNDDIYFNVKSTGFTGAFFIDVKPVIITTIDGIETITECDWVLAYVRGGVRVVNNQVDEIRLTDSLAYVVFTKTGAGSEIRAAIETEVGTFEGKTRVLNSYQDGLTALSISKSDAPKVFKLIEDSITDGPFAYSTTVELSASFELTVGEFKDGDVTYRGFAKDTLAFTDSGSLFTAFGNSYGDYQASEIIACYYPGYTYVVAVEVGGTKLVRVGFERVGLNLVGMTGGINYKDTIYSGVVKDINSNIYLEVENDELYTALFGTIDGDKIYITVGLDVVGFKQPKMVMVSKFNAPIGTVGDPLTVCNLMNDIKSNVITLPNNTLPSNIRGEVSISKLMYDVPNAQLQLGVNLLKLGQPGNLKITYVGPGSGGLTKPTSTITMFGSSDNNYVLDLPADWVTLLDSIAMQGNPASIGWDIEIQPGWSYTGDYVVTVGKSVDTVTSGYSLERGFGSINKMVCIEGQNRYVEGRTLNFAQVVWTDSTFDIIFPETAIEMIGKSASVTLTTGVHVKPVTRSTDGNDIKISFNITDDAEVIAALNTTAVSDEYAFSISFTGDSTEYLGKSIMRTETYEAKSLATRFDDIGYIIDEFK